MDGPRRSGPNHTDTGIGDASWRPSSVWLVVALLIVAGGVAYWWTGSRSASPAPEDASTRAASSPVASGSAPALPASAVAMVSNPASAIVARPRGPAASASAPRIARHRDPDGDQSPDITDYINEGEVPTMAEVISRLNQAGVHTGLGAFQPPGTRPPLVGLAVPEDFALPPGYVRHYQATDDGQRIEPILMFSPDHQFFDAAGRPIAIPKDRVVPPELAPPGMPQRRIVVPAPTEPRR